MSRPTPQKALRRKIRERTAAPSMTTGKMKRRLVEVGGKQWPEASEDHEGPAWRESGPEHHLAQFKDEHVEWVLNLLDETGLADWFDEKINAAKEKSGRPGTVSCLGILVALWLCAETGRGMLSLHMRDVLFHQISDKMKAKIGIRIQDVPPEPDKRLAYDLNTVACVRRRFRTMLLQIDPSPLPKNRRMPWQDLEQMSRDLQTDDMERLQAGLDWVCNQMLEAAWRQLPVRIRQQYTGSACIDATPLKVGVTRGNDTICPSDPDGGVYKRDGDHTDPADGDTRAPFTRTRSVQFFAYDVHLIVAADDRPGIKQHLPSVPLAMTLTRPGEDPAGSARRMFASAEERGHETAWLSGDALYSNQNENEYQIPALEAGRKVIMTYTDGNLGKRESHESGAHLVEGWYFCPSMPKSLVNATIDLRKGRITKETWRKRIEQRQDYRMRRAEKADEAGFERFRCPAAGTSPIAVCPFKAKSLEERPTRQPDGTSVDTRVEIDPSNLPTETDGKKPQVCRQDKVRIHVTDGAKYRQTLQYGTDEHYTLYNLMRQSQEGEHGRFKDEAYEAFGSTGKRRMRGRAVQSVFAAFLLAASAVRKIRTFLAKAQEPENDDADVYVLKRDPKKRRNTWNSELPDSPDPPELEPPLAA